MKSSTLSRFSRWISPATLGLALLCQAHAGTIVFDNSTSPTGGSRSFQTNQYQSFSTGTGSFSLTDVEILLQGSPLDSNTLSIDLYGDSSTAPGSLLDHVGTFTDTSLIAGSAHLFDFATAAFALTQNTRYWIGLSTTNGSSAGWDEEFASPTVPAGDVGVTGQFKDDTGVISPVDTTPGGTLFRQAFQMQVTVSPTSTGTTPEPSSMVLGGAGLAGLALLGLRRRTLNAGCGE
jgi:MYXO-CTERM domain-containing protein